MFFTPGQAVIVLDTLQKPAGQGIVFEMNRDTQLYEVSFRYPDKEQAEIIPLPAYRLLADTTVSSQANIPL